MKLLCSTSIRLPRITRPMVETLMKVSSAIGSTMKRGSKLFQPPAGSHCRPMAKTMISTGPMTKLGTALPMLPSSMTR